jgi:hypothetical protein
MSLMRRKSKRDKAVSAMKRKGAKAIAKKLVPTRVLVIVGGAGAAIVAAVTLKKRKGSSGSGPSYAAPTGPPAAGS